MKNNQLHIGGVSSLDLVKEYGSPLYVYDQTHIENQIRLFQTNFQSTVFQTRIAYASKAFLVKEMVRVISQYDLSLDLVSLGEMHTALQANFNMKNAIIHGNNKSIEELKVAIKHQSLIVVDNIMELEVLIDLANQLNIPVKTLLRVNPGIEAHTHEYIITAKLTSKFGESIYDTVRLAEIIDLYNTSELVHLEGFHCHIGSQVFELDAYLKTIDVMGEFISQIEQAHQLSINTLNIGGGFGVYYTDEDTVVPLDTLLQAIIKQAESSLHIKELIIEPGRSIISNAGTTLYDIGYYKKTYGGKDYLFIEGGMTDNIRPALYQAKYSADIASNMNQEKTGSWTIAGKLCESGDVLIHDIPLQPFDKNDVLAIYTTGAYTYSMASNYNKIRRGAVLFVKDGLVKQVVKKESLEDLIRNEL